MSASLDDIVSLAKRRGFVYPGSEIYGGLAGTYDYGPLGAVLKRNIVNAWFRHFVDSADDMYQVDTTILMNPKVWQASGHVDTFTDPLVECSNCHSRFREDQIDRSKCPNCGKENTFGEARQFNMMFKTSVGPVEDEKSQTYLRPETAQGMFTNFRNVVDSFYPDIPFGLAQEGNAFRNEISPREFLFRTREFEIMELEYFVQPDNWEESFNRWHEQMYGWFEKLGLPKEKIHEVEVAEADRAHYSKRTIDFEFEYPFGTREIAGLAYRTDFDLKNHQEKSGKSMEYRPKDGSEPFLPHVIEPTFGVERHFLAVLANAYTEDEQGGEKRIFLKLPASLAPVKVAVSPLLKNKPELVDKAKEVYSQLKKELGSVMWDDNGNIGKRYRRQDEIGTPHCVTVDFQSLEDNTVTLRDRDTTEQHRINADELLQKLKSQ
jgi:glycyl-tRNA synthetase